MYKKKLSIQKLAYSSLRAKIKQRIKKTKILKIDISENHSTRSKLIKKKCNQRKWKEKITIMLAPTDQPQYAILLTSCHVAADLLISCCCWFLVLFFLQCIEIQYIKKVLTIQPVPLYVSINMFFVNGAYWFIKNLRFFFALFFINTK